MLQRGQAPLEAFDLDFPSDHNSAMHRSREKTTYETSVCSTMPMLRLALSDAYTSGA